MFLLRVIVMNTKRKIGSILLPFLVLAGLYSTRCSALVFPLSPNENVVGGVQRTLVQPGETLSDVGRRFDIGLYEMQEANPGVSGEGLLPPGTHLLIPSRFVLPPVPREGIVINLAELRLYYYPEDSNTVITLPVGIGRVGWHIPLGVTKIVTKRKDPAWHPTDHVRAEAQKQGFLLPAVWSPGQDNPMGQYAMNLAWPTYIIHGSAPPYAIGQRSSAGCFRMFPEDIETLYSSVKLGTKVTVLNDPIKMGWRGNKFYLETHKPYEENGNFVAYDTIHLVDRIHDATKDRPVVIKWQQAQEVVKQQSGIPTVIGTEGVTHSSSQDPSSQMRS
jgi:L,D-transpeptidase ErfK/SrfK